VGGRGQFSHAFSGEVYEFYGASPEYFGYTVGVTWQRRPLQDPICARVSLLTAEGQAGRPAVSCAVCDLAVALLRNVI
jgi:hypothetical protein